MAGILLFSEWKKVGIFPCQLHYFVSNYKQWWEISIPGTTVCTLKYIYTTLPELHFGYFLQEDITPEIHVKFGQELLLLDTWCGKKQYDMFCSVLGSGMNYHLAENRLLREIFDLGDKVSNLCSADLKQFKHDRVSSLPKWLCLSLIDK